MSLAPRFTIVHDPDVNRWFVSGDGQRWKVPGTGDIAERNARLTADKANYENVPPPWAPIARPDDCPSIDIDAPEDDGWDPCRHSCAYETGHTQDHVCRGCGWTWAA